MVLLEGVLYGLYSAVPGSAAGVLGAYLLFGNMNNVQRIPWITPWPQIFAACGVAIALGALSAIIPLRRIGRMSAVESIRAEE
jgi:putative ABC transport system permease protein